MLRFLKSYTSGGSYEASGCVSLQPGGNHANPSVHAFTQNHLPSKSNQRTIIINSIEELPQRYKTRLLRSGITLAEASQNIGIVLNILHFRYRRVFVWQGDQNRLKIMDQRATRAPSRVPVLKGEGQIRSKELELINSDNPTEIFEEQAVEAKGGFGKVVRAIHTVTNAVVAVKKVKHQNLKQQRDNLQEIMFMEEAKELPNIVKYYTSYEHPPHLWIVMEYVEGAPLSLFFSEKSGSLLQRLTEDMLAYLAQQILIGLEALHLHQIAHRDIKPSNIILSIHGQVKLIDFGLCVDVSGGPDYHMVGSSYWMAPEVIRGALHSTPVDMWGFGICMAELINGVSYSSMTNSVRMMFDVAIKGMPQIKQGDWSDTAKEFVESCLLMDPQARPTATQLLEHEFMEAILEDSPEYLGNWVHWAFYESDDDEEMDGSNGSKPKINQMDEEISEDD